MCKHIPEYVNMALEQPWLQDREQIGEREFQFVAIVTTNNKKNICIETCSN